MLLSPYLVRDRTRIPALPLSISLPVAIQIIIPILPLLLPLTSLFLRLSLLASVAHLTLLPCSSNASRHRAQPYPLTIESQPLSQFHPDPCPILIHERNLFCAHHRSRPSPASIQWKYSRLICIGPADHSGHTP